MSAYRAGLVGCGRIGALWETDPAKPLTHAGALSLTPGVQLVAGSSRGCEHLEWFGRRFNVTALYQDFRRMFAAERLEVVAIATHPGLHRDIVEAAVESGVRGILCEKPLALNLQDADTIVDVCRRSGCVLAVNHSRRWNPAWIKGRELVQGGAIGKVTGLFGVCQGIKPYPAWTAEEEGPLIHDAVHLFDQFRAFAGNPLSVVGTAVKRQQPFRVEDDSQAIFEFEGGVSAVAMVNELTRYSRFELEVQGTQGLLLLSERGHRLYRDVRVTGGRKEPDPRTEWWALEEAPFPAPPPAPSILRAAGELVRCMETGETPSSTGEDGVASLEMCMGVYESQLRGNSLVSFPLRQRDSQLYRLRAAGQL